MSDISIIGSGNMASAIGALALKGGNAVEVMVAMRPRPRPWPGRSATAPRPERGAPPRPVTSSSSPCCSRAPCRSSASTGTRWPARSSSTSPTPSTPTPPGWPSLTTPPSRRWSPRPPPQAPMSSRRSTPSSATSWPRAARWTCSWPAMTRRPRRACQRSSTSLGLRPRDAGDLSMAHWLEGAGLLSMGLARNGVGNFNFSLGVNLG